MATDTSSSGTPLSDSDVENDNLALPFRVEGQKVNGRVVRLNGVVGEILAAHDYPEAVNIILGEALVLAAMLGTMLKFDGRFILQLHGAGPISTLMADYTSGGGLRGFAQFEAEQLHEALRLGKTGIALLGDKGHMAFTVDQGADMERYQGIVPLEGETLAEAALGYFQRSEQIGTCLKLVAAPLLLSGGQCEWRAGGIVLQQVATEGVMGGLSKKLKFRLNLQVKSALATMMTGTACRFFYRPRNRTNCSIRIFHLRIWLFGYFTKTVCACLTGVHCILHVRVRVIEYVTC